MDLVAVWSQPSLHVPCFIWVFDSETPAVLHLPFAPLFAKLLSLYCSVLCLLLGFSFKAASISSCCYCSRQSVQSNCWSDWKRKNCFPPGKMDERDLLAESRADRQAVWSKHCWAPPTVSINLTAVEIHWPRWFRGSRLTAHLNTKGLRGSFTKSSRLEGKLFH